jgi:hypothetical protein
MALAVALAIIALTTSMHMVPPTARLRHVLRERGRLRNGFAIDLRRRRRLLRAGALCAPNHTAC